MAHSGLSLLIDNTTLHRLALATNRESTVTAAEVANFLHLVECMILAEDLTVARYESRASQERSDQILDWLEGTNNRGLVKASAFADEEHQKQVAANVAQEMFDRGLLFRTGSAHSDLDEIDVALGRPVGVVERASEFWDEAARLKKPELIQERALEEVALHRTDGLFEYGLSRHEEVVARLVHAYENGSRPTKDDWDKMHVVFRALFNQQHADLHEARSYAPPPVRANVLRNVYSQTIQKLRDALSEVAFGLQTEMSNTELAEELIETADKPLPLLGLAYILQATAMEGPGSSFADRLSAARELAAPMRSRLAQLEDMARTNSARYVRALLGETEMLEEATRARLGLPRSKGLSLQVDIGVSVDPSSGTPTVKVGMPSGGIEEVRNRLRNGWGRKRVSVLSDGLARTTEHRSLTEAINSVTS
jgi:hypothetical protein